MTRIELTTLAEDDQLLDALGRGETPNGDDPVATLLGDWRAVLPETCPVEERPTRPAQRTRRRGRLVVAATVALVAAGGVTAAAEHAEPDSPLWPVTRLLYGDLADSRAAGHAADEAVTVAVAATENGRYDHATELLDQAATLVEQVDDPATAQQLRSRIATVRAQIATATADVAEGIAQTPVPPAVDVPSPSPSPRLPAATTEPGNETGGGNGDDNGDDNSDDNSGGDRNDPARPGNGPPPTVPALPTVPRLPVPGEGAGR